MASQATTLLLPGRTLTSCYIVIGDDRDSPDNEIVECSLMIWTYAGEWIF